VTRPVAHDHARVAYDAFAPFYDDFTADHDDVSWTGLLLRSAEAHGLAGRRLLDVGCGTGRTIAPMVARGFVATGCDISPAMVAHARARLEGDARIEVGDMRSLGRLGAFDLVWSLGDSCNYLQSAAELEAAFGGFRRNLAPGGVVVIDLNTLRLFRCLYSSLIAIPGPRRVLLLDGHGAPDLAPGGRAEVWIDRLEAGDDGRWRRARTVHHHRHHPFATVVRALRAAGLDPIAALGAEPDGTLARELDEERHHKAVFIARDRRAEAGGRR
jgi:SAM-dependent methyltransferase